MAPNSPGRVPFLIVGGGLAAATAAEALRAEGAEGRVVVLSAEPERPYHRPPLSKGFLRGETPREDVFVHPGAWAREHEIELRPGARAERLDVGGRTVALAGGEEIGFERLLVATGASPRPLRVPGADLEGVFLLRTLADADRIRAATRGQRRAVVVGGGFIGAEVAASLRQMGIDVALITRDALLWERLFGAEAGRAFQGLLLDHGVEVVNGDEAARIDGAGRAERVVTRRGRVLPCDLVVAGVGVRPRTDLAEGTPLRVEDGIVVDEGLATDVPGIYAAGDVARFYSPLYGQHLRVEHWDVAERHGRVAGRNMARDAAGRTDQRDAFDGPPYFFSDLFDLAMEYLGHNAGWDDVVQRGQLARRDGTAFYLKEGRLVAALFVNRNQDVDAARALIQQRLRVDDQTRQRLADPAIDLREPVARPAPRAA